MSAVSIPIEAFVCIPLQRAKLTRSSCAARHLAAAGGAKKGRYGTMEMLHAPACATCPVGAAHARGEAPFAWSDGKPIEMTEFARPSSSVPAAPSAEPTEVITSPAPGASTEESSMGYPERKCDACTEKYTPTGARQRYCVSCGPKKKAERDAKPRAPSAPPAPARSAVRPARPPAEKKPAPDHMPTRAFASMPSIVSPGQLLEAAGFRVQVLRGPTADVFVIERTSENP